MKHKPKIVVISETRIRKNKKFHIPGYNCEFTPAEAEKGGTLLYVSQDLKYKNRSDLNISQAKELESSFIELENKNRKNTIVVCIYKHTNMSIKEFILDFLEPLLAKMSFVLLGDTT